MTTTNTHAEFAAIHSLLAPWLHVDTFATDFVGRGALAMSFPPYTIEGIVKADDFTADTPARGREILLARAEHILKVLDDDGWQLTSYPEMEFTGKIVHVFVQTFGGELVKPAEQGAIRLRLSFAVDRPR